MIEQAQFMKKKLLDDLFWNKFQQMLSRGNPKAVADFCFFESDQDKEYFFKTYDEVFDDTAIDTVKSTKAVEFKKILNSTKDSDVNPFDSMILPVSVTEVYILKVAYKNNDSLDDDYYKPGRKVDSYVDDFDDFDNFAADEFGDIGIENDDVIDYIKVLVFGHVGDELKFLGSYIID